MTLTHEQFKQRMRELADSALAQMADVLKDPNHKHYNEAREFLEERGIELPNPASGRDGEPLTIRVVREG
jgi:hypothetical protein